MHRCGTEVDKGQAISKAFFLETHAIAQKVTLIFWRIFAQVYEIGQIKNTIHTLFDLE